MILDTDTDTDKEIQANHDYQEEKPPRKEELTDLERKTMIEEMLQQLGYELDPELIDIVNKEGDFEEWTDPYSNYLCRISRMIEFQHWNGYVRIPKNHPCYGKHYDDIEVEVHGGLSFADHYFPSYSPPIKDENYYFVGYDTGHAWDRSPRIMIHFSHPRFPDEVYRTKEYVIEETTKLAKQLKDIEENLK
jgi:hypothetical protein